MRRFSLIAWEVEAEPVAFPGPATALPNAYAPGSSTALKENIDEVLGHDEV
ncbi:hypothetical protein [Rhizobium leguminosarum]|uniref:hypothetical protein n=1 Tax=Rhizobium leguminosarum TaxID=384 RepID=UPI0013DBE9BC|nr:hypothetical protein [Rhizobium leguminosarum]NEI03002.1 hypothetical protein [Rhizobium leguminosarum]NEJ80391.1 hypothetical protein [Rhizobium leguminosarum]